MEWMARVRSILLKPKETWVGIKAEPATVAGIFSSYVLILAAVPPAAQFVGRMLFRAHIPFARVPVWSVGRALSYAILAYALSLVIVGLLAFIVDALAPGFSSVRNMTNAFKLVAYSMTPGWAAGILNLVPGLQVVSLLGFAYGFYLMYLGFEAPMMDTPREKVMGYFGISIIAVLVLAFLAGLIIWGIFAFRII
ncbi:MAG: Yip1 family protein [Acidobacteriota bacterium]